MKEESMLRRCTNKLFGGLDLTWPRLILFSLGAAVLTFICLMIPAFKNTSFVRIGETLEAWILFAVIIMSNCKKPLESAAKTFVFFLISQPLIYLLQVPFSWQGWGLFQYYRYWFILTLLTFPAAFIGWYIKKKNYLSALILLPVIFFLTYTYVDGFKSAFRHFPHLLLMALFCLGQVLLYMYVFMEKLWVRLVAFLAPLAVAGVLLLRPVNVEINSMQFLPDDPILTENATISVEEQDGASMSIESTGKDSRIRVITDKFGTTHFTITDGDKEYRYVLDIYEDENGSTQIKISPQ